MSLTLHLDASDTGKLFTTYQASGVHTGTPSDGSVLEVWDDEGDGVTDVCLVYADAGRTPAWRSTTPLMLQPCLDFDGADDYLETYTQTAGASKPLSSFITAGAYTVLIACYPEVITSTAAIDASHQILGDANVFVGLFFRNVGGQRKVAVINWAGSYDSVEADVNEATRYVIMARHDAGNLYLSVNGGTEVSVASGNTTTLTARLAMGQASNTAYYNGRIGEVKIWNTGNADGAGNVATEIAAMMAKWVTAAPTTAVIAQDRSIRRRLHPRVFSRVN